MAPLKYMLDLVSDEMREQCCNSRIGNRTGCHACAGYKPGNTGSPCNVSRKGGLAKVVVRDGSSTICQKGQPIKFHLGRTPVSQQAKIDPVLLGE